MEILIISGALIVTGQGLGTTALILPTQTTNTTTVLEHEIKSLV